MRKTAGPSIPSPYRPAAVRGADPLGRRPSGPLCGTRDPWAAQKAGYVAKAWDLARIRHVIPAVAGKTSREFTQALRELIDKLLIDVDLLGATNAGDLGTLGVGAKAVPGRSVGLGSGYAFSLRMLEFLEAGFLTALMVRYLDEIDAEFQRAVGEAWDSGGFPLWIDGAGRRMADAVAAFFALLLEALVTYLTRELAGPARGRLRPVLARLRETPLFERSHGLDVWILRHYDRLLDQFTAAPGRVEDMVSVARGPSRLRANVPLPDISLTFQFRQYVRDGKTYKQASGALGVPGRVRTHRSGSAQRGVSAGSGDDAGHLIGDRFGAPGGPENLSNQNWIANRYGTFKGLEDEWAAKLRSGIEISVTVNDITKSGEDRPFVREVRWSELTPENIGSAHERTFANTQTPRSREARGIGPTVAEPQEDNVIDVDFRNKTRLD